MRSQALRLTNGAAGFLACLVLLSCMTVACGTSTSAPASQEPEEDSADPGAEDAALDGALDAADDVTPTACHTAGCPCTQAGDCTSGVCQGKTCAACVPTSPPIETCNGKDDDCNGQTDESTCPWPSDCQQAGCDAKAAKCVIFPLNLSSCSDGNACTLDDRCTAGVCIPGGVRTCSDGTTCTTDSCAPKDGCVFTPVDVTCTDDDACTSGDHCAAGACTGVAKVCNDDNPCTTDGCAPDNGTCLALANTATCDDGDVCVVGDHCSGGKCVGVPVPCDDKNPCTDDGCVPGQGCVHVTKQGGGCP